MDSPEPAATDRADMLVGAVGSLTVNLGWMLLVHTDQRILLTLFASVLLGMGLLLSETKGALGMGIIFGAGASIAVGLALVALTDPGIARPAS